ncbi:SRPBCC domain-containing protein [Asticcacaulis sp. DXS10W]|uniref:SRPBCC domain-containing protein n=1 Tax=Asticcacaulis currens TaxID=2984210 RepID=A0ABT5IDL1_9CAUL|nr:SRPBCC domain-containing protein [Asticcacaulis currens]MDC7694254.1 SRPBCC domain-containing protein [Asticcacaulis currens]
MNGVSLKSETKDIVVDETFPHSAASLWRALTTPELMGRWLMTPADFEPIQGKRFTYQTTAKGQWDGQINCEVLEAVPNERLSFSWKGGHETNEGYGSRLETTVTFTITPTEEGSRLQLVHAGFELPKNEVAFTGMGSGWPDVLRKIGAVAGTNEAL